MKQQTNRVNLTAGRVEAFTCPTDKAQAFLWDTDTPTLALRVTPTGRKTYVFEARKRSINHVPCLTSSDVMGVGA